MYLTAAEITNIRALTRLRWRVSADRDAGWHVILGANGSGKSTLLRSIALGLIGSGHADALRQDWAQWLRNGHEPGRIELELSSDPRFDPAPTPDTPPTDHSPLRIGLALHRSNVAATTAGTVGEALWNQSRGWFSASYGPFRRFSGGDREYEKLFSKLPRLARHLSVFDERVALTECLEWLRELRFKQLEGEPQGRLLELITRFINQDGFLPFGTRLKEVASAGVTFVDGARCEVTIEELSDGFRSILSLTLDLIRQLAAAFAPDRIFTSEQPLRAATPGVVLIDEIDAHLHPSWQRQVGPWFRKYFPRMQFLVTTHSPLICQTAVGGSVFLLPSPGSAEEGRMLTGTELNRLLYGDVLEAYGSAAFGAGGGRSDAGEKLLDRLAELNVKEIEEGLSDSEGEEQERLRAIFPTWGHELSRHVANP